MDWLPCLVGNISLYGLDQSMPQGCEVLTDLFSILQSHRSHSRPKVSRLTPLLTRFTYLLACWRSALKCTNQLELVIALTKLYQFYYDVLRGGEFTFKLEELHAKYGTLFWGGRIQRNLLIISCPKVRSFESILRKSS